MGVGHDFFDELKGGGHNFFDGLKGGVINFFVLSFFKSSFLCHKPCFFLYNLVEVLSNFWRKWVMKLRILCPPNTELFLGKGALPPYNPHHGASPLDPCKTPRSQTVLPTTQNGMMPMHRCAQRGGAPAPIFDDSRGNFKLVWKHGISGGNGTNWEIIMKFCGLLDWLFSVACFKLSRRMSAVTMLSMPFVIISFMLLMPRYALTKKMWILPSESFWKGLS